MPNPQASDGPHWAAALEHYHWDRLEDAMREASEHGLGEAAELLRWYRVIEAETLTRRRSTLHPVNEWLTFEFIESEIQGLRDPLIRQILAASDEVASRLGWDHREQVLVTILAEETEAPWSTSPFGYCTSKENFEKICLPAYLVDEPDEFEQAVAHEYAHVISASLTDDNAPRWLEEAVSVLVEHRIESESRDVFLSGKARWLSPGELETTLEGARDETEAAEDAIWQAYQQVGWIGRYLVSLGDEARLGQLLREVADEGFMRNLVLTLRGRDRIDGALERVYGFDSHGLFRAAQRWLGRPESQ